MVGGAHLGDGFVAGLSCLLVSCPRSRSGPRSNVRKRSGCATSHVPSLADLSAFPLRLHSRTAIWSSPGLVEDGVVRVMYE